MNINELHHLHEYCINAAYDLIDAQTAQTDPIAAARDISADQLESAAFTNNAAFGFDSDAAMIITFETICAIICNITNCSYDDICAEY